VSGPRGKTYNGKGGGAKARCKVRGGTIRHEAVTEDEAFEEVVSGRSVVVPLAFGHWQLCAIPPCLQKGNQGAQKGWSEGTNPPSWPAFIINAYTSARHSPVDLVCFRRRGRRKCSCLALAYCQATGDRIQLHYDPPSFMFPRSNSQALHTVPHSLPDPSSTRSTRSDVLTRPVFGTQPLYSLPTPSSRVMRTNACTAFR
jgi:hypothetical protein